MGGPGGDIIFEPELVTVDVGTDLLSSRLPTAKDRSAGKAIYSEVQRSAHDKARQFAHLDHSAFIDVMKAFDLAKLGPVTAAELFFPYALEHLGWAGVAGPLVLLVNAEVLALVEIGQANQTKEIADRRRAYYDAFANGIALALDGSFAPRLPRNPYLQSICEQGRGAIENFSTRDKRLLVVVLLEDHYFKTHHGARPSSLDGFWRLMNGEVFYDAARNSFETMEYLTR